MIRVNKKYRYPWRDGGQFGLLVDGRQFFPCMIDAINDAREFVCLETYLMESGSVANRFIDAIIEARRRHVNVYLLLDHYGCRQLRDSDVQRLRDAGAELEFYNPFRWHDLFSSMRRDHRKMLLIDGALAFVGGAGITDDFVPPGIDDSSWHELMIRIEGPVLQDWLDLFTRSWQEVTGAPSTLPVVIPSPRPANQIGRVSISSGARHQEINRSLIKRCRSAERRIWISTPYFIVSRKIRRALRRAARRGVDVRVLVPGPISDHPWVSQASRGYYMRLLRAGVRIFEYQPRFIHAKVQLCDSWSSLGSCNLDRWNQRWNLDANQEVEDTLFAEQIAREFEKDFNHSEEILFANWRIRPRHQRLREWFWGRLVYLLERLRPPKRKLRHRKTYRSRK